MPSTIFSGSKVKTLKDTLTLNDKSDIISSTTDPTAVAVSAPIGSLLINQTSGKLYRKLDSGSSTNWEEVGSGVGGINYILNPSAEVNTTGWATYADAAGASPVDGTGGSPNVTWTRSTTTPLRGVADFNFAKDAANRQGQGVSYDFTIDEADKAKVLTVSFDYEVLTGTYADGDLTVYLIADPSGTPVVIQPAGYTVLSATSGTTMKQIATFQTQATGTSYRLCFHVASSSASAYTLAVDNVVVGPQTQLYGAPITDWVAFTPTVKGVTTDPNLGTGPSLAGRYRRIGDSMEVAIQITLGTTPSAGSGLYYFPLPTDAKVDTTKCLTTSAAGRSAYGIASMALTGGASYQQCRVQGYLNGSELVIGIIDSSGVFLGSGTASFNMGSASNRYGLRFIVPIQGWSSTVQMSNDTDTRVVAFNAGKTAAQNVTLLNTFETILFDANVVDTHGTYNSSTGTYTIPVSGYYHLYLGLIIQGATAGDNIYSRITYTGGVITKIWSAAGTGSFPLESSGVVYLNAGDSVRATFKNATAIRGNIIAGAGDYNIFSIRRLSGPATIAASESVNAAFTYAATASPLPNGTSNLSSTYLTYSKLWDSHGIFSPSAGSVTIPISGKFQISAMLEFAANATGSRYLIISQTGSVSRTVTLGGQTNCTASNVANTFGTAQFNCLAGDVLQFQASQTSGVSLALASNGAQYNHIDITRVGN